jgi:hypothetical protein
MLTGVEIGTFIEDGFVRIDGAFSTELAEAGRAILWRDAGVDPNDRSTWTRPVIRLGAYGDPPFVEAANTPTLHEAYDQLVGAGRWIAPSGVGTFPIRFPSRRNPGDAGWHIDVSFPDGDPGDFMTYRANIACKGRVLLMLFLFSDVGPDDAPTRVRVGSHKIAAELLARAGEHGLRLDLGGRIGATRRCGEALATGAAGTVYLCHPFLVHAAQKHRGKAPRFMAQPPLQPVRPFDLNAAPEMIPPVERASRDAVAKVLRRT